MTGASRTHACKNALLACELAGSLNSILLCDINHTVYTSRIKYFWQIRFWPATYPRYRSFFGRLAPNDLNVRILLFQKHGAAHDSPCGPHGTHEKGDCPFRVFPYFRSEEHTSEFQSRENLVCRLLLEKKNNT